MKSLILLLSTLSSLTFADGGVGNGGFVDESAKVLLSKASDQLAHFIELPASEAAMKGFFKLIYGKVPDKFSRAVLIHILKNLRLKPEESRLRGGRKLLFDYGVENGTPYVEVLKPFFEAYTAWEIDHVQPALVLSLQQKLLHEASHTWGFNQKEARVFSRWFPVFLRNGDAIFCTEKDSSMALYFTDLDHYNYKLGDLAGIPPKISRNTQVTPFSRYGSSNDSYTNSLFEIDEPFKKFEFTQAMVGGAEFRRSGPYIFSAVLDLRPAEFARKTNDGEIISIDPGQWKTNEKLPHALLEVRMNRYFTRGTALVESAAFKNKAIKLPCEASAFFSMRLYGHIDQARQELLEN